MDHKTAESLSSVDKYLLNEMSAAERTQFEEHMFDCPICSDQVRRDFTITENLKEVLREEKAKAALARTDGLSRGHWHNWLRMPSLVPTLAALTLACLLGFQHFADNSAQFARVLPTAPVLSDGVARGGDTPLVVNRGLPAFLLNFTVDASRPDVFTCEFNNAAGKRVLTLKSPLENTASFILPVELPAKNFPPGQYEMILRPASEPDRIKTYSFSIQDSN